MSHLQNCDLASFCDEICHKTSLARSTSIVDFSTLSEEERNTYLSRAGGSEASTICLYHMHYYGTNFEKKQNKCDIFNTHTILSDAISFSIGVPGRYIVWPSRKPTSQSSLQRRAQKKQGDESGLLARVGPGPNSLLVLHQRTCQTPPFRSCYCNAC